MITRITSLSILLFSLPIPAEAEPTPDWTGKKIPKLVLENGKTYTEVVFKKIDPDAVTINHASGVARIDMRELKEASRSALGYDSKAAEKVRANARVAAAKAKLAAAEKHAQKVWESKAIKIVVDVIQVLDDGLLVDDVVIHPNEGIPYVDNDTQFISMETAHYNVYDGMRLETWAVPLADRYVYETVLGARRTVQAWSHVAK